MNLGLTALVGFAQALLWTEGASAQVDGGSNPDAVAEEASAPSLSLEPPAPPLPPPPGVALRAPQAADPQTPAARSLRLEEDEEPTIRRRSPDRSGLLFLPAIGAHSFQHDSARNYGLGPRLGVLMGWRFDEVFSANAEAAFDVTNPTNVPVGISVSGRQFHVALSPLVHATNGVLEFVMGPKLGRFVLDTEASSATERASSSYTGWLFGLNVGLFGPLTESISLGVRLSYDLEDPNKVCLERTGFTSSCQAINPDESLKVLGTALALLM